MATTLTVVVMSSDSQPFAGASVSISPSDASAVTNSAGEVQFTLGTAKKYDITATVGSNTVTVPYYVTANGATRLIVNPGYVKAVEAQLHPSVFSFGLLPSIGIILGIVIVGTVVWKLVRRK